MIISSKVVKYVQHINPDNIYSEKWVHSPSSREDSEQVWSGKDV